MYPKLKIIAHSIMVEVVMNLNFFRVHALKAPTKIPVRTEKIHRKRNEPTIKKGVL